MFTFSRRDCENVLKGSEEDDDDHDDDYSHDDDDDDDDDGYYHGDGDLARSVENLRTNQTNHFLHWDAAARHQILLGRTSPNVF